LSNTDPTNTGVNSDVSEWVIGFCPTSGTRRVTLITNPVIPHEYGKERIVNTN